MAREPRRSAKQRKPVRIVINEFAAKALSAAMVVSSSSCPTRRVVDRWGSAAFFDIFRGFGFLCFDGESTLLPQVG